MVKNIEAAAELYTIEPFGLPVRQSAVRSDVPVIFCPLPTQAAEGMELGGWKWAHQGGANGFKIYLLWDSSVACRDYVSKFLKRDGPSVRWDVESNQRVLVKLMHS
ncbi:Uncharacterized protein Fot_21143 [Forsythia ovata]|uniref:Uncharacterized protein n=1 Tax=Forsythia ovata TaxID=205694 RepID=A0ABD1UU53_9LAMI